MKTTLLYFLFAAVALASFEDGSGIRLKSVSPDERTKVEAAAHPKASKAPAITQSVPLSVKPLPTDTELAQKFGWARLEGPSAELKDPSGILAVSVLAANRNYASGGYLVLTCDTPQKEKIFLGYTWPQNSPLGPVGAAGLQTDLSVRETYSQTLPALFTEVRGRNTFDGKALSRVDLSYLRGYFSPSLKLQSLSVAGFVYFNWFGYHSRYVGEVANLRYLAALPPATPATPPATAEASATPAKVTVVPTQPLWHIYDQGGVGASMRLTVDYSYALPGGKKDSGLHLYWDNTQKAYIFCLEDNPRSFDDPADTDPYNYLILAVEVAPQNYPAGYRVEKNPERLPELTPTPAMVPAENPAKN